jgi:exopolysaccharide biosynthesis polyprenyl glycosylphosphotransferase
MYGFLVVIMAGFLEPELIIARGWLLLVVFFTLLCTALGRFGLRRVAYAFRRRGYFLTPTVIIGANQEGRWLAEQFLAWQTSGLRLIGFVDELTLPGDLLFRGVPVLGSVAQLDEIVEKYQVGEIILATSAVTSRKKQLEIFKKYGVSDDVTVRMSSGLYEIMTTGMTVDELAYVPFVKVNKVRLTGLNEAVKMALDYFISIPVMILGAPFFLLLALAVKLDSPGSIIYRRGVMGVNGRRFDAYKFRTMRTDGDKILEQYPELKEELAQNHKLKNDPRVTRVGKFMRKLSLDELPQLINVLKRDMSLVGPRMITPEETVKYEKWDMNLLTVRPGITGLWQVSGRSDVSYEERVQLDMYYVRNWSIWLDLQIIIQTIPAVIKGRGAY